jgi:hypothetical protein
VKPAKNFGLDDERADIINMFVELCIKGAATFGDQAIKSGERTISMYAHETLAKHATKEMIIRAIDRADEQKDVELSRPEVSKLVKKLRTIS